ncbi:uncharacterized protein C8Q71DRAFT_728549 [Rhodofomes roseus]|uniref:Uncharacterized protein n=1 Tax=Rhodofomes roseus TaxID=34475 RepID=A0ABQ8JX27_9APHY|nr:uncharacterized protein C8Q71DRAFT_728549 [Rhodofomes roseus]KAH9828617.1 hypothetical protein C8Q71DRAFT_728549 [Rhodofomes roseus]
MRLPACLLAQPLIVWTPTCITTLRDEAELCRPLLNLNFYGTFRALRAFRPSVDEPVQKICVSSRFAARLDMARVVDDWRAWPRSAAQISPSCWLGRECKTTGRSEWCANGRTEVTESHTLAILAKIANDPAHAPSAVGIPVENSADETMLINVLEVREQQISVELRQNGLNGRDKEAVHRKVEELNWKKVLLHGVGGWAGRYSTPSKKFDGGFFLLRLVTSVLFLHSYVPNLSPTSISILLRAYFSTSLALYIARGRPALPIRNFYASAANPPAHALSAEPTTSAWFQILQSTLAHNDDYLAKLQHSLAHFASLYGATPAGLADATNEDRDPRVCTQREDGEDLGDASVRRNFGGLYAYSGTSLECSGVQNVSGAPRTSRHKRGCGQFRAPIPLEDISLRTGPTYMCSDG